MDNSALLGTLTDVIGFKGEIARKFAISAVDTNTGDYVAMTQKDTPIEDLPKAALASASIPVVFPPTLLNGYVFQGGGTAWTTNLYSAVEQCREIVDDYSDIIVDIAICGHFSPPASEVKKKAKANY